MIWERVETSQGQCMTGSAKLCGPINSMGHTAHVVANRMIVIFGHSPKYGYLDTVQEYHFFNKVSHFFLINIYSGLSKRAVRLFVSEEFFLPSRLLKSTYQ